MRVRHRHTGTTADQVACHLPPDLAGDPDADLDDASDRALSALEVSLRLAVPSASRAWPPDWSTFAQRWADACEHVRARYDRLPESAAEALGVPLDPQVQPTAGRPTPLPPTPTEAAP